MKNEIATRHRAGERWQIQHIATFKPKARGFGGFFQEFDLARREVIETNYGMTGAKKLIGQITAYEACCTRDKCSQNRPLSKGGRSVFFGEMRLRWLRAVTADIAKDLEEPRDRGPGSLRTNDQEFKNKACKSGFVLASPWFPRIQRIQSAAPVIEEVR